MFVIPAQPFFAAADLAMVKHHLAQRRPPPRLPVAGAGLGCLITTPVLSARPSLDQFDIRSACQACPGSRQRVNIGQAVEPLSARTFKSSIVAESLVAGLAVAPRIGRPRALIGETVGMGQLHDFSSGHTSIFPSTKDNSTSAGPRMAKPSGAVWSCVHRRGNPLQVWHNGGWYANPLDPDLMASGYAARPGRSRRVRVAVDAYRQPSGRAGTRRPRWSRSPSS